MTTEEYTASDAAKTRKEEECAGTKTTAVLRTALYKKEELAEAQSLQAKSCLGNLQAAPEEL